MKQINPLYMALLLIVVLVVVVVKLSQAKTEQYAAKEELRETVVMAKRLSSLKEQWDDREKSTVALQRILNDKRVKAGGIEEKKGMGTVILSGDAVALDAVNYLMNKLLNGPFAIKSATVERKGEAVMSLYVELVL